MKIGVITFHWATNYGAVLQAYALQKYLSLLGHDVTIIDYCPRLIRIKQTIDAVTKGDFNFFKQEKALKSFKNANLQLSDKVYSSHKQLMKNPHSYDCIIAGSDQIWNKSFTLRGEGKVTLSYFLDFANDNIKRIAYAVSFGFHTPTQQYIDAVTNEINKFSLISVREADGLGIVEAFGLQSCVVCDPTALLSKEDYLEIAKQSNGDEKAVFAYILRNNQNDSWRVARYVGNKFGLSIEENRFNGSMGEWLSSILKSQIVVTNSFHGIMLSLIMNKPFVALTINGSGMNSRITTLLDHVGLSSRLVEDYSEAAIESIVNEDIDWVSVNQKITELRSTGVNFLHQALEV